MSTTGLPDALPLPGKDEVHVWTVLMSECLPLLVSLLGLLSVEERERAARFQRPEDRARHIIAHGRLRQLLGEYLLIAPVDIAFARSEYGKPALTQTAGQPNLSFNMAHSGDVILFALAVDRRVGVDVEAIRSDFDPMELAQSQFSADEVSALQAMATPDRTKAFFRCWTRKEACVKALGQGLSFPLRQFTVSCGLDEPPYILKAANHSALSEHWKVFDLVPATGYVGAVVADCSQVHLLSRRWVPAV